jgi:CAP12/Pycsar effector protein, TIR domain
MTPPNTPTREKPLVEELQDTLERWNRFLLGTGSVPPVQRLIPRTVYPLRKIFGNDSDVVKAFDTISEQASKEADPKVGLRQLIFLLSSVIDSLRIGVISDIYRAYQPTRVFVGHGRNPAWSRVVIYLRDELQLETDAYETESHASEHIVDILKGYLDRCNVAVIIMTADDATALGTVRARQNVVHEAGLFQGRYGFGRVFLLQEAKTEEFSNIAGLQTIRFNEKIEEGFYELGRALQKLGL